MLRDFLEDYCINKLNGYFLILYASGHLKLAWAVKITNNVVVSVLVFMRLIPARRRLS